MKQPPPPPLPPAEPGAAHLVEQLPGQPAALDEGEGEGRFGQPLDQPQVVGDEEPIRRAVGDIRSLRDARREVGLKAFVLPVDEVV